MADYKLFDQVISYPYEMENFIDVYNKYQTSEMMIRLELTCWYKKGGNFSYVVNAYQDKSRELIEKYGIDPYFKILPEYEIYDVSKESFMNACFSMSSSNEAYEAIAEVYSDILKKQSAEETYREIRKETRGRVVGGGFGVGGAITGMAAAGAINAVTGAGHSIANAIGNAYSAMSAESSTKELYNDEHALELLISSTSEDVFSCSMAFIAYMNTRFGLYARGGFSQDKAAALFENSKTIISKQRELLFESVKQYPWRFETLEYIYINYPAERKNIWNICNRFNVNILPVAERIFSGEYTGEAMHSEEKAQMVKASILSQMKEYGIEKCDIIDTIETDGLRRIAYSLHSTDEEIRKSKLKAFTNYDASDKNKREVAHECKLWELASLYSISFSEEEVDEILTMYLPDSAMTSEEDAQKARAKLLTIMEKTGTSQSSVLDKLENSRLERLCADLSNANETECNQLITKINAYPAMDKNKEPFLERVQNRITDIWSKQDAGTFDNLFLSTNLLDPADVQKTKALIQQQDRTNASTDYIKALNICTHDNIQRAKKYQTPSAKFYLYAGIALEFIGFFVAYITYDAFLVEYLFIAAGFLLIGYYLWMRKIYNTLTFKKKLIHSTLSIQMPLNTANPVYQTYKPYEAKPLPPTSPVPPASSTGSTKPVNTTSPANSATNDTSVNNHQ